VRIKWAGREVIHHQKAVVAIAADGPDLGYGDGFAAGEQFQLVSLSGKDG